eukprot:scaffold2631_cov373-Pavlova_lutheri.AAC.8
MLLRGATLVTARKTDCYMCVLVSPDTLRLRLEGIPATWCATQSRPVFGPQRQSTTPPLGLEHSSHVADVFLL